MYLGMYGFSALKYLFNPRVEETSDFVHAAVDMHECIADGSSKGQTYSSSTYDLCLRLLCTTFLGSNGLQMIMPNVERTARATTSCLMCQIAAPSLYDHQLDAEREVIMTRHTRRLS
jgi:hypothetical protein